MPKRKRDERHEVAAGPRQPMPSSSSQQSSINPPTPHCQPRSDNGQFVLCLLGICIHCRHCIDCQMERDLAWQTNHALRATMSVRNAELRLRAEAYDKVSASFNRDNEAHDQIFALQDQLAALQQQVAQLQQALPAPVPNEELPAENLAPDAELQVEVATPVVRKYENDVEDLPDLSENVSGAIGESDPTDEPFYSAVSKSEQVDEVLPKQEENSDNEFALIDQIPSSGQNRHSHPRDSDSQESHPQESHPQESHPQESHPQESHPQESHPMVLIDRAEHRYLTESSQENDQLMPRGRPHREVTLRTPRQTTETSSRRIGGTPWTDEEDRRLRKGLKKGMTLHQIQGRYLPDRSVEGIKKRKSRTIAAEQAATIRPSSA